MLPFVKQKDKNFTAYESMCTWYIIIVVEVKAFGIHSLYPDFRVFDSVFGESVLSTIATYYREKKVKSQNVYSF